MEHLVLRVDLASLGSGDMAGLPALAAAPVPEWWPFRNQMLVTLAAMLGISKGAHRLLIGCLATDGRHADGRAAFVEAMDAILAMQEGGLRLEAPAVAMTAVDLVRTSGIPSEILAWAHSCHVADHACGMYRGCQKHYETLEALGHAPY
jgi:7-cyano-7-deazaguanine synthase